MEVDAALAATYVNDANGSISIGSTNCVTSECNLVVDKVTNPHEDFERKYAKWWPFRLIKIANLLPLVAIIIGASICASIPRAYRHLIWSDGWDAVGGFSSYYDDRQITWACFILAVALFTFGMHWVGRKKASKWPHFMASVGITDICLSFVMLIMLIPILFMSTLNTIAEIRWYYPQLLNESTTLAQLVEWEGNKAFAYDDNGMIHHEYDYINEHDEGTTTQSPVPTTPSARILVEQEKRKNAIMTRLWMDPPISFFAFLALLINLIYAVRLIWLFKKTKMWSSDYRGTHLNCSQLDMGYARFWPFGLLKVVQWIFPGFFFLTYLYITFKSYDYNNYNIRYYAILASICLCWFFQWLFYVQKVRLHPVGGIQVKEQHESNEHHEQHQLAGMCKMDLLFSIVAILVYLFLRFVIPVERGDEIFHNYLLAIAISLNAATMLFTFLLLKRHAGSNGYSGLGLNIPGISINISINIQRKDDASRANSNTNAVGNANVEEGGFEMPK